MSESEKVLAEFASIALRKAGAYAVAGVVTVVAGPVVGVAAVALYFFGLFSLDSATEEKSPS